MQQMMRSTMSVWLGILLVSLTVDLVTRTFNTLPAAFALGFQRNHVRSATTKSTTELFNDNSSTPKRQPRRNLQKRRKRSGSSGSDEASTFPWEAAESRPIVASRSKELGEDYWVDPNALALEEQRKLERKNRPVVGQVPKEKLWTEVLAPYQQNWIGVFSMVIAMITVVIIKFPELLNPPVIQIPDI